MTIPAMFLAMGLLSALLNVQRGGEGQVVDAAMVDGAASLATIFYGLRSMGHWRMGREQNVLDGGAHFYNLYETQDGQWVSPCARLELSSAPPAQCRSKNVHLRRWG